MPNLQKLEAQISKQEEELAELRRQRDEQINTRFENLSELKEQYNALSGERDAQTQSSLDQFFHNHGDLLEELNVLSKSWGYLQDHDEVVAGIESQQQNFAKCMERSFQSTKALRKKMLEVFTRLDGDFNEGEDQGSLVVSQTSTLGGTLGRRTKREDSPPKGGRSPRPAQSLQILTGAAQQQGMDPMSPASKKKKTRKTFINIYRKAKDEEQLKMEQWQKLPWKLHKGLMAERAATGSDSLNPNCDHQEDGRFKSDRMLVEMADILKKRQGELEKTHKGKYAKTPDVEVGVHVHKLRNLDTAKMEFEAVVDVFLEWKDHNMILGGFTGEDLLKLDWENDFFNPVINIANSSDTCIIKGINTKNHIPRFRRKKHDGLPKVEEDIDEQTGQPILTTWMKKQYQIAGIFKMQSLTLEKFPCDMQKVTLIIKAESFRTHPIFKNAPNLKKTTNWTEDDALAIYCDECSLLQYKIIAKNAGPRARADTQAATPGDTNRNAKAPREDQFVVEIWVERLKRSHHWYALMFVFVLPLLCSFSIWDMASASISSRLSICLLIILALAEYTSHRPQPIERSTQITLWDKVLIVIFAFNALLVVTNTVSVTLCGGDHPEAPPYMTEIYNHHQEICGPGWCYSRKIDCNIFTVFVFLFFATFVWLYFQQAREFTRRQFEAETFRRDTSGLFNPNMQMNPNMQ